MAILNTDGYTQLLLQGHANTPDPRVKCGENFTLGRVKGIVACLPTGNIIRRLIQAIYNILCGFVIYFQENFHIILKVLH